MLLVWLVAVVVVAAVLVPVARRDVTRQTPDEPLGTRVWSSWSRLRGLAPRRYRRDRLRCEGGVCRGGDGPREFRFGDVQVQSSIATSTPKLGPGYKF